MSVKELTGCLGPCLEIAAWYFAIFSLRDVVSSTLSDKDRPIGAERRHTQKALTRPLLRYSHIKKMWLWFTEIAVCGQIEQIFAHELLQLIVQSLTSYLQSGFGTDMSPEIARCTHLASFSHQLQAHSALCILEICLC